MDRISEYKNIEYQQKIGSGNSNQPDISLEEISILYTTTKKEDDRTTFDKTFKEKDVEKSKSGQKFLNGLISNKDELMSQLGLSSEKYDSFACIALAIASQETGMGEEIFYDLENSALGVEARNLAKEFTIKYRNDLSASSGLTQMKIYDLLNTDINDDKNITKLTDEQKEIIKSFGIVADDVARDNLYKNPDKAAVASIVLLTAIEAKYDDYLDVLKNGNQEAEAKLTFEASPDEMMQKGNEILEQISQIYENADSKKKISIRNSLKNVLLSSNGSKIDDKSVDKDINEGYQLNNFNTIIGNDVNLSSQDLDYIRYVLTSSGNEMTKAEFCAYGWNKGTARTGMQLDRLLADKIGVILANPEDFDYDQFTVNVPALAEKYAEQSVDGDGSDIINRFLAEG